ncbi:MAG: TIGR04024 family LLM class F420-dependent oxidoreductase [Halobacteriaceae archaeon]
MTDTARDLHLPVAAQPRFEDVIDLGTTAERLGYDRVWMPETWGRDAVTVLATLAARTTSVGLGTSIVPVYSRSAALIGQTAATLQEASGDRFRLGIGPSGPALIEHWHSTSFDDPLRRTREYLEAVRAVCSGDTVTYSGETVSMEGFRLRFDPPSTPPIDVAAMGPKAVELAGRFADGWHALLFTPDGLRDRLEDLQRGAELGDRDPSAIRTMAVVTCCALPDGDTARRLAKQHVAFYVGAMGPFYRSALARQGFEATADRIHDHWQADDQEAAVAAVEDGLLDALCAAGTPDMVRDRLRTLESVDGVDAVAVSLPRGADEDAIAATVEALAPEA